MTLTVIHRRTFLRICEYCGPMDYQMKRPAATPKAPVAAANVAAKSTVRRMGTPTLALFAATPRFDRPGDLLQPIPAALTQRLDEEAHALDAHVRRNDG